MSMTRSGHPAECGFTIVELVIAMTITLMLSGLVINFMVDFWRSTASLQASSESLVTRQNASDRLRDALNPASHLIDQNSIADTHAEVADTSDATGTHWLLIHAIPGSIPLPAAGSFTPVFYFTAPSTDTAKNFIMNGAQPYYDEFIVYMDGSTKQLLMRTLVNPSAGGDRLTTTCPPDQTTATCPADTVISSDITSVDVRYFSRSGLTIDYTSVTDPNTGEYIGPDFPAVDVVEITLHLTHAASVHKGVDSISQTIVRVALRNS